MYRSNPSTAASWRDGCKRQLVFPNTRGRVGGHAHFLENVWQPLLAQAKLPYRKPHALRHSYATWLLETGTDIRWVQQQMGHASIGQSADTYGHVHRPDCARLQAMLPHVDSCFMSIYSSFEAHRRSELEAGVKRLHWRRPGHMPLDEYRKKRRFDVTKEPAGKRVPAPRSGKRLVYVVQKHRATALHYDFRLEWKGVMLSWAVPKGPSFDPAVKRLAMQVEDHPIEYNKFEGIIPDGEYGGGTVMIWDAGHWTPEPADVDAALKRGELKFRLEGKKLRGSWVLVRTRGRPGDSKPAWLLIKHRDEWTSTEEVTELAPRSIVSNRLLVEIARDEGGNVQKAADGDPPALLREILNNPGMLAPVRKSRKKAVWHSNRAMS